MEWLAAVIGSLISGAAAVTAAVMSARATQNKIQSEISTRLEVTNTKVEMLAATVTEHNNFARRMPVVEEKIEQLNTRVIKLEAKVYD